MSYASERSLLTGLRIGQALSAPLQDYMNQKRQREWELQDQETRRGDRAQSVQDQLALQVAMGNLAGFQKSAITPASGDRPATVGAIPVQMDASGQPTAYEQNRSPIAVGMGSLIDPQENATFQALKAEQEAKARDQALRSQLAMKNEFDVKGATAKAEALEPFEIRKQQREADEKRGFMDVETTNKLNALEREYQLKAQNQDNEGAAKLANDIAVLREKARLEAGSAKSAKIDRASANYAAAIKQGNRIISELEKSGFDATSLVPLGEAGRELKNLNPVQAIKALSQNVRGSVGMGTNPNILKTPRKQQYDQAADQVAEAALRFATGAAAPSYEKAEYKEMYIPQMGDSEPVKQQKAAARARLEQAMVALATGEIPPNLVDDILADQEILMGISGKGASQSGATKTGRFELLSVE